MNNKQKLPFEGIMFGTWWGNDTKLKQQSDVDVVMANRFTGQLLLGECKWRNEFKDIQEIEKLLDKGRLFPEYKECYYAFFSKVPYSKEALNLAEQHKNLLLYTVDDLFLI